MQVLDVVSSENRCLDKYLWVGLGANVNVGVGCVGLDAGCLLHRWL